MSRTVTKIIDDQEFEFTSIPATVALMHAPRAQSHFAAIAEAAEQGAGDAGVAHAFLRRMTADEMRFWVDLLFERVKCEGIAMKTAMDAGRVKGGVPTMEKVLIFAMDFSCGPFGGLAGLFEVLRRDEPSTSSASET